MMKKFSVAMLASIMLGAFGACKNEPDTVNVTVLPVHLDIKAREVSKRTGKDGIGGLNETTTRLWFEVDSGNFNGYQPKNVIFAPVSGESRGISISPLVSKGTNQEEGYWHVYSADIDPKTPITANGFVSFALVTGEGDNSYRASAEIEAFYAEPVVLSVRAQDGSAERGTTELTVELNKTGVELYYVYVDGVKTKVSPEGVISINNRSTSQKSVNVEVKNEDGNDLVTGINDGTKNLSKGYGVANRSTPVVISPAVSIITFEANGDKDVIGTTKIKAKSLTDKPIPVFVDNSPEKVEIPSNASGFLISIDNKGEDGTKKTKVTIRPDMTDDDSNGYYIQEEVVIVPAVRINRAYPFSSATEGSVDKKEKTADGTPYVYYFAVNPAFPDSFLDQENVTVIKSKDTEHKATDFCLAKKGGTSSAEIWGNLTGDFETYAISFTLPEESSDVTFSFKEENGFYISELPSKL